MGDGIGHVAVDDRGLVLHERIHVHGVRIGDEHHVRFLDLLETTNRGAIETVAFGEMVFTQHVSRDGDVLHDAGQVGEAEIDEFTAFVLHQLQYFFGSAFLHGSSCGGAIRSDPER